MKTILKAAALAALLSIHFAYPQQTAGTYRISGTVQDASTGKLLDRANVAIFTPGPQGSQIAETTTAEDGSFIFDHLSAGKYRLDASRRGYIATAYDEHESFSTAIVTGPGLSSEGLHFRMQSAAVIGGVVTDEAGDPVNQAQVMLYRQNTRNGLGNIVHYRQGITNDAGSYEFTRLEAGNYYISVSARPWYATSPNPKLDAQGNPLPESTNSPLDVAYQLTFYANVTDSDDATPIPVKSGDHIDINFSLHPVPAVHLRFAIPNQGRGAFGFPMLSQDVFGARQIIPAGGTGFGNGIMRMDGVAPGQYQMEFHGQRQSPSRFATIDLTSDQEIDSNAGAASVDVSGKIAMASGAKLPNRLFVSLQSEGRTSARGERVADDGSFTIHNIAPGSYEMLIRNPGSTLAVIKIAATGATAEGHILKVGTQPVTVVATLGSGETNVTGFAKRDGKPASSVMVLLVPQDPGANHELFRRDQSDSDGSFTLYRAISGKYTLIAIEDGWTLDWAKPEVIGHYLAHGMKVSIPEGKQSLDLSTAVEVQPR